MARIDACKVILKIKLSFWSKHLLQVYCSFIKTGWGPLFRVLISKSRCKFPPHNDNFVIRTMQIGSGVEECLKQRENFWTHFFLKLPSFKCLTDFIEFCTKRCICEKIWCQFLVTFIYIHFKDKYNCPPLWEVLHDDNLAGVVCLQQNLHRCYYVSVCGSPLYWAYVTGKQIYSLLFHTFKQETTESDLVKHYKPTKNKTFPFSLGF